MQRLVTDLPSPSPSFPSPSTRPTTISELIKSLKESLVEVLIENAGYEEDEMGSESRLREVLHSLESLHRKPAAENGSGGNGAEAADVPSFLQPHVVGARPPQEATECVEWQSACTR